MLALSAKSYLPLKRKFLRQWCAIWSELNSRKVRPKSAVRPLRNQLRRLYPGAQSKVCDDGLQIKLTTLARQLDPGEVEDFIFAPLASGVIFLYRMSHLIARPIRQLLHHLLTADRRAVPAEGTYARKGKLGGDQKLHGLGFLIEVTLTFLLLLSHSAVPVFQ